MSIVVVALVSWWSMKETELCSWVELLLFVSVAMNMVVRDVRVLW